MEPEECDSLLGGLQTVLFPIGSELSCIPGKEHKLTIPFIQTSDMESLEREINQIDSHLQLLKNIHYAWRKPLRSDAPSCLNYLPTPRKGCSCY
ncbi:hypothetical protein BCY86_01520 [Pajaroellobacter abortibovis]|uniref:Uncharacterized protein n=1 Tax=Pajaroellobacter abortibovis TaxID=1882918 RepID=A0A1L6MVR4_9BACT|nr:hypothetical protein BCY86_01520 [Pajaroellobacter abortibovis]